jgi:hypothetical protein
LDIDSSSVRLAVSPPDLATGTWKTFNVKFAGCPDQPSIAVSSDKFAISANVFGNNCTGNFLGAEQILIRKADLLGSGSSAPAVQVSGPDQSQFSLHPVQTFGTNQRMMFVSDMTGDGATSLNVVSYDGQIPNARRTISNIAIITTAIPPGAEQPGSTILLNTNDGRILSSAIASDNKTVWVTLNDACRPQGDTKNRSCIRLVEFDSTTNQKLRDFDIGSTGTYFFYPALTVLRSGSVVIVFGASSSTLSPSIYMTGLSVGANTIDSLTLLRHGTSPNVSGRYGDYEGAAIDADPADPNGAWIAGEYNPGDSWSTAIIKIHEITTNINYIPISGASSTPVIIQTNFGKPGNNNNYLLLLVPNVDHGFTYYWKNSNVTADSPWNKGTVVGVGQGHIDAVSIAQNNNSSTMGSLNIVVRVGDKLMFYWLTFDNNGLNWHGPVPLTTFGS